MSTLIDNFTIVTLPSNLLISKKVSNMISALKKIGEGNKKIQGTDRESLTFLQNRALAMIKETLPEGASRNHNYHRDLCEAMTSAQSQIERRLKTS